MTSRNASRRTAKTGTTGTRHRTSRLPYYEQARIWQRYLWRLSDKPFDAYQKKEDALSCSIRLRSKALVVPARLASERGAAQGLRRLRRWTGEDDRRFVELAAKVVQIDVDDPSVDEVHLFVEEADRTSSRSRRLFVGRLPQEDACWTLPLLKLEADHYGTGPLLRFFACCVGESGTVQMVIAGAHEAARSWLDWKEDRQAYRARCQPW